MSRVSAILICITAFSFQLASLTAQTAEIQYADQLFLQQQTNAALKEYLRAYYLDQNNANPEVCGKIARCFLLNGDDENALKYLDLYFFKLPNNDVRRNEVRFEKQKIFLVREEYQRALVEVLQITKRLETDLDRFYFMTAINYFFTDQYDKGKSYVDKLSYSAHIDSLAVAHILKDLEKNSKKNPNTARWMSAIVPGTGQMANGEIKDGLNSMALYVLFGLLYIDLIPDIGLADATLSVGPWITRYYLGGLSNAVRAAKNNKLNKRQRGIQKLIDEIEKARRQKVSAG
jgi:tetratricopeptide (TPR) repeat protein